MVGDGSKDLKDYDLQEDASASSEMKVFLWFFYLAFIPSCMFFVFIWLKDAF
jgi:hypothetical protein